MIWFKWKGWIVLDKTTGEQSRWNGYTVNSSNVDRIAWPQSGEPAMLVQFHGGARYIYLGVTRQKAVACGYSKSVGKFVNERIKPHYEAVKLR